jgi:1-pyrroline-5-carboxylate dehydrogenase
MAPIIMGNVVIWKPSPGAIYSNWLFHQIMMEAGLPPGVLQFIPGDPEVVTAAVYESRDLGGLHFTGSTAIFRSLSSKIGSKMGFWRSYPRVVGETGRPKKSALRRLRLIYCRWQELPSHSSQC